MIDPSHKKNRFQEIWHDYRSEIKFVTIFVVGLVAAFFFINNEKVASTVVKPITVAETKIASVVLNLSVVGFPNKQSENIIRGKGDNFFQMEVKNNCNGIYESIVFLMAFIAIQVPWRRKIGWMAGGFLVFHIINELRLVTLFIIGSTKSHETFVFFHETFWQYTLIILTLAIFLFCADRASRTVSALRIKEKEDAGSR
ncbi:MAG: hypothetical protein CSA81_06595 [Acidobacteria bacterium]|nr:MAG: hypothetical protein CSA81_06595 [Acidobacteriota bacterium]